MKKTNQWTYFGSNWEGHEEKIKQDWLSKVKEEDAVILPGDISWGTYIEEAKKDLEYIDKLPGTKIILKGNHDYWWSTISAMEKYLKENNLTTIKFLHNNSYEVRRLYNSRNKTDGTV